MNFVHVDSIIMDMEGKSHNPIILCIPFLRSIGAIIEEGNVKFQFLHKKRMKHFPRKKEGLKNCPDGMCNS
jgi:hypothetical protein